VLSPKQSSFRTETLRRLQLFKQLVGEASPFFIFFGVGLFAYVGTELLINFFQLPFFYTFGFLMEISGIFFVVIEITSVRKQVGMSGFLNSVFTWFRKSVGLFVKPKPISGSMSATLGGITLHARGRLSRAPASNKFADRITALEQNLLSVNKELDQIYGLFDATQKDITTKIDEKTRELSSAVQEMKAKLADVAAGDSALKLVGVMLVLVGFAVQNLPKEWGPPPIF
jgi:hypothetical protein